MFRLLLVLISTLAPLFVAKAVNGSIETSKALTANAIDRITARVLRQVAWTMVGAAFVSAGAILGALEAAQMWGVAFTPTLGVEIALIAIGGGCLYVGLRKPKPMAVEMEKTHEAGVDWQTILAVVLDKIKASAEVSHAEAAAAERRAHADLSPEDLDRIITALRDGTYSRARPSTGPDLTAH